MEVQVVGLARGIVDSMTLLSTELSCLTREEPVNPNHQQKLRFVILPLLRRTVTYCFSSYSWYVSPLFLTSKSKGSV